MGRWEPNAQGRLQQAAMELFGEHGYEQTTVAEIAERAGLSERTFFRHYADKREVLFGGTDDFRQAFVAPLERAATGPSPLELVSAAVAGAGAALEEFRGREFARARRRVIIANPELRERELIKLADVTAAMAAALRARGVEEPDASMLAELGMAAFRVAFGRWVAAGEQRTLPELTAAALASVTARAVPT
ncbi:MAG: TetR family transcriptional regulator [Acidobacteriota bacterium]|nr:TetR family transcriptional regulator [Acidobacteriota bacterium]